MILEPINVANTTGKKNQSLGLNSALRHSVLGGTHNGHPFLWTVAASFKTYSDLFYNPYRLIPTEWTWTNLR